MPDPRMQSDDLLARISDENQHGPSSAEVEDLLKKKEIQLSEIKRLQEQLARESEELEEFTQRKEELARVLEDMLNRLQRSMVMMERAEFDQQKTIEEIRQTREKFQLHLDDLTRVESVTWSSLEQKKDLYKAMSMVDAAREDYNQAQIRLEVLRERHQDGDDEAEGALPGGARSFRALVREGFAQNLVLILAILFLAIVIHFKY
ncbi:hypothetical protein QPK87_11315 [Kamptonema cortianum]|nr:hypothetical protein [Oscillatoria laete-virens]MDK3157163.1 hypothetical protein [Kamptonema cortianum]MDL5055045.1 hypothetical protein [Oscillatoria laete-virens NRMC-F 0139]